MVYVDPCFDWLALSSYLFFFDPVSLFPPWGGSFTDACITGISIFIYQELERGQDSKRDAYDHQRGEEDCITTNVD